MLILALPLLNELLLIEDETAWYSRRRFWIGVLALLLLLGGITGVTVTCFVLEQKVLQYRHHVRYLVTYYFILRNAKCFAIGGRDDAKRMSLARGGRGSENCHFAVTNKPLVTLC